MSTAPGAIVRRGGISKTVFIISLVVVGAASGVTGYLVQGLLHPAPPVLTLNGAGSTFVFPLIAAIDANYSQSNPNIQINYQSVGSGAGITQLGARTVDFGASDAPLTSQQMLTAPNALTIPDTIGAVAIAYNLPGIATSLRLNVTVAAKIFQGDITVWNDTGIQALNPSIASVLPNKPIIVVHRFESSGTTFVFSGYLSNSSIWRGGQAKTITVWPASSQSQFGNQGVANFVQGTKYTIGYVELNYALSTSPRMSTVSLWNPAGQQYIAPTLSSSVLAASTLPSLPAGNGNWSRITLLNSNNGGAYPIVTFSYIMVYQELNVYSSMSQTRAQAIVNYLWFVVNAGQNQATPLDFVALPTSVVTNAETTIRTITFNGQPLHS